MRLNSPAKRLSEKAVKHFLRLLDFTHYWPVVIFPRFICLVHLSIAGVSAESIDTRSVKAAEVAVPLMANTLRVIASERPEWMQVRFERR